MIKEELDYLFYMIEGQPLCIASHLKNEFECGCKKDKLDYTLVATSNSVKSLKDLSSTLGTPNKLEFKTLLN